MPRVPTTTSTSPLSPAAATEPRPPGPTAPVACASSTISRQSWRRARRASSSSGATSPSIEKTPSVTIREPRPAASRSPQARCSSVAVAVDEGLGPREPAAVDDAGVVELVGEDDLASAGEGGDRAHVGEVARAEQQRRLVALELGQPRLQPAVHIHVAGDQPRGPGSGSPAHRRLCRRLPHTRVAGQPQVVVGAEQQHRPPVEQDARPLRPADQPQPPVEPPVAELLQPVCDIRHAACG